MPDSEVSMELMHELLKKVHADIGEIKSDLAEIKSRITSLEHFNKGIIEGVTGQGAQLDRLHKRLVRTEKRFELTDEVEH